MLKLKMTASFLLVVANTVSVTEEVKMMSRAGWNREDKFKNQRACMQKVLSK